ncbi:MAG TPA: hypothetical protein VHJ82_09385, partial [Actinomycetota bacterium]|nr:hypothetical protein [Actinomycetota bacterium]
AALVVGPGAAVAVAIAAAVGLAAWVIVQGRLALRRLGARPAGSDFLRASHLLTELAKDLGVPVPRLWVASAEQPNALLCRAGGPSVLLTSALVEEYTRTELEAVLVHCLCRCNAKDLTHAQIASAFGGLGVRLAPAVGEDDDVMAASVTRYPPALASAIRKAVPMQPRWSPFWFVAERAPHRPVADRIALLADL